MTPNNSLLDSLLREMWLSGNDDWKACAANYRFDERVSMERQRAYESALGAVPTDFKTWKDWHQGLYTKRAIHRPVPETFTALNADAAHAGDLLENGLERDLVRVECLSHALGAMGLSVDEMYTALEVAHGRENGKHYTQADAMGKLEDLCGELNANPYGVRPRFAGFLQDVEDAVDAKDWPNQVRDRFGLGHHAAMLGAPIPIALMRYKVRDVMDAAQALPGVEHPVCVPTVLDSQFSRYFVPSPREFPYGRTLDLADDVACERKIAEILHPRLEYRPEHIFKIGAITTGLDKLDALGVAKLRENHLFCLQYASMRDDFGVPPDDWSAP